jgi:hypothetical protein
MAARSQESCLRNAAPTYAASALIDAVLMLDRSHQAAYNFRREQAPTASKKAMPRNDGAQFILGGAVR